MDASLFENCNLFAGIPARDLRKDLESVTQHIQCYDRGETAACRWHFSRLTRCRASVPGTFGTVFSGRYSRFRPEYAAEVALGGKAQVGADAEYAFVAVLEQVFCLGNLHGADIVLQGNSHFLMKFCGKPAPAHKQGGSNFFRPDWFGQVMADIANHVPQKFRLARFKTQGLYFSRVIFYDMIHEVHDLADIGQLFALFNVGV